MTANARLKCTILVGTPKADLSTDIHLSEVFVLCTMFSNSYSGVSVLTEVPSSDIVSYEVDDM